MFLENEYARPLFDFDKGGEAKAFQCLHVSRTVDSMLRVQIIPCGKITRTERGMRMHLKYVHDWEEQPCLYLMDKPKEQKTGPRKLRLFTKENIEATTKRSLMTATEQAPEVQAEQLPLIEPKTSDEPSLKPTSEEK